MKSKKQKRMKGRGKISSAFSKWLDIFTEFQAQHGGYFCVGCCTEASFSLFNLCITIGKCQQCKKKKYTDIFFSLMFQHTFWLLAASVCLLIWFLFVFSSFFPGLTWAVRTWRISRLIQASAKWDSQRLKGSCLKVQFATRVGPVRLKTQKQSFKVKWRLKQQCNTSEASESVSESTASTVALISCCMRWFERERSNTIWMCFTVFSEGTIDVRHGGGGEITSVALGKARVIN